MKIVVADDDPVMVSMLADHLADLGHSVTGVYDGAALIDAAMKNHPDLIISDIDMPGVRGEAAQAMIEMYPPLQDIPFIAVTGIPKKRLYDLGLSQCTVIIEKPVNFDELDAAVSKIEARRNKS